MNYGDLKTSIYDILGRSDVPSAAFSLATTDISRRLSVLEMQATTTLSASAASVALPSDFKEVVSVYVDSTPRYSLKQVDPKEIHRADNATGVPAMFAIVNGALLLGPTPDSTYSVELRYIGNLTALSADSDENDVLTAYPDVYTYGVLAHHARLVGHDNPAWEASFQRALAEAQQTDTRRRFTGGPMRIRPRVVA